MEGLSAFFDKNSIYVVLFIVLTIWFGIFMFLYSVDKRLKKIELDFEEKFNEE
ncbi:MAG: CcmD family protein [bacterium]